MVIMIRTINNTGRPLILVVCKHLGPNKWVINTLKRGSKDIIKLFHCLDLY